MYFEFFTGLGGVPLSNGFVLCLLNGGCDLVGICMGGGHFESMPWPVAKDEKVLLSETISLLLVGTWCHSSLK